jgi:hypothetical protein
MWGALSEERTGLSFTIAADPRQRSHSRVRVPHFTVSDLRVPFSSPPTTRGATVEVFDPASTRGTVVAKVKVKVVTPDLYYRQTVAGLLMWGALSDERTVINNKFYARRLYPNLYIQQVTMIHGATVNLIFIVT